MTCLLPQLLSKVTRILQYLRLMSNVFALLLDDALLKRVVTCYRSRLVFNCCF